MKLPDNIFSVIVEHAPLVSVDLVISTKCRKILLGKRINNPAARTWFTPGGRIFKNEKFFECVSRLMSTEIGLSNLNVESIEFAPPHEHIYPNSSIYGEHLTTHYINIPCLIAINSPFNTLGLPKDQHSEWRWWNIDVASKAEEVHEYVRPYFSLVISLERSSCITSAFKD